jgi:hypothetical protein
MELVLVSMLATFGILAFEVWDLSPQERQLRHAVGGVPARDGQDSRSAR